MNHFLKAQIYETQAILYWILGVLILHLEDIKWLGWLSIGWGWLNLLYVLIFTAKHRETIKKAFAK